MPYINVDLYNELVSQAQEQIDDEILQTIKYLSINTIKEEKRNNVKSIKYNYNDWYDVYVLQK